MAGFIYAIENVKMVGSLQLEEAGLTSIFSEVEISQRYSTAGPGGGECVLLMRAGEDTKLLYFKPKEQHWDRSLNEKYWLGFYEKNRPTPEILARENQINGHEVELNGQKWRLPLARMFPEGTMLPETLLLGRDGKIIKESIPRYAEFSRKAETLWEDLQKILGWMEGKRKLTEEEKWSLIVEALSFNYHVGPDEINALKLISTANLINIYGAIVDLPSIISMGEEMAEARKKTGKSEAKTKDG